MWPPKAQVAGIYLSDSSPILSQLYPVGAIRLQKIHPPRKSSEAAGAATISDSLVEGVDNASDPLFVRNPLTRVWTEIGMASTTITGDLHLQAASPAIDQGNQDVIEPVLPATDLDGRERVWNGAVDLGAYENHTVTYVRQGAAGADDGSSWSDAFPELRDALAASRPGDEIWVAAGTYTPGTNRMDTFQLTSGVAIYGGFAGTESVRSDRDPGGKRYPS